MDRRLELDPMESDLGSGERLVLVLVLRPGRGDSEPLEAEREALLRRGCTATRAWSTASNEDFTITEKAPTSTFTLGHY